MLQVLRVWICDNLLNGGSREREGGRVSDSGLPGKDHASVSHRETLQQMLAVLLVNSWHNESAVPPLEFQFSTLTPLMWTSAASNPHHSIRVLLLFRFIVHISAPPPIKPMMSLLYSIVNLWSLTQIWIQWRADEHSADVCSPSRGCLR